MYKRQLPELAVFNRFEAKFAGSSACYFQDLARDCLSGIKVGDFTLAPLAGDLIGDDHETDGDELDHLAFDLAIDVSAFKKARGGGAACGVKLEHVEEPWNEGCSEVALVTL